jgi:hypothetical protein
VSKFFSQVTSKTITGGRQATPQTTEAASKLSVAGKTLFLNRKNCDLCNKMYPK